MSADQIVMRVILVKLAIIFGGLILVGIIFRDADYLWWLILLAWAGLMTVAELLGRRYHDHLFWSQS